VHQFATSLTARKTHMSYGIIYNVICHPAEVTFLPLPQPISLKLMVLQPYP